MSRAAATRGSRVVVKVGSSSITEEGGGLQGGQVEALVAALAAHRGAGAEIVLVSSGAIAAGLEPLGLKRRPRDLATQQAAASVGQGLLIHRYTEAFAGHGIQVGQVLLTADDVIRRAHYRNAQRTLYRLLELGVLPVVNENDTVATDEIRFGDNDRLAALVAHLVHADLLVLLSDVDGLYEGDPRKAASRRIEVVDHESDLDGVVFGKPSATGIGTGGIATKVDAARIATGAGVPVVLARADQAQAALNGRGVGTYFSAARRRTPTRLLWLAHAASTHGSLVLDAGAVSAVVERRASLLPAGVISVDGTFVAGDPVDLLSENGHVVARGLVNFDSVEMPMLLGRSTRELARERGTAYEREVVHRDDLIVLT
ncbi:MAG: glutamate 5-kinase [Actinomycetes bacterium]